MRLSAFAPRSPEKSLKGKVGSVLKSVVFIFSTVFLLLLFVSKVSFAQSTSSAQQNLQTPRQTLSPNTNPDVPINLHTWTQSVMIEVMAAAICQLSGVDVINRNQNCLGVDTSTGKIGYVNSQFGLLGFLKNQIIALYTPPLHTSDYFKYLASNFGIAKPTYAQGYGFVSLSPLQGLWVGMRNVTYVLFVLIFIVIGLAIMLRVHIDPRTVMTVQNQIPKLVIGLILVTLSYAIAGFLIDLMYIISYLIVNVLSASDPNIAKDMAGKLLQSSNPLDAANIVTSSGGIVGLADISGNAANAIAHNLGSLFANPAGSAIMSFVAGLIGYVIGQAAGSALTGIGGLVGGLVGLLGGPLGAVAGASIGSSIGTVLTAVLSGGGAIAGALDPKDIAGFFISIVAFLIIIIAILFALLRLWIKLLLCYITILLDVVFAPFWIAAGLLPGTPMGMGAWLRDIVANLAAFPTAVGMFVLIKIFVDAFNGSPGTQFFVAPLVGNPATPNEIGSLIALGMLLSTPNVIDMVKKAFKSFGYGGTGGISSSLSTGQAVVGAFAGGVWGRMYYRDPKTGELMGPVGNRLKDANNRFVRWALRMPKSEKPRG